MVFHLIAVVAAKMVTRQIIREVAHDEWCEDCGAKKKKKWFASQLKYYCEECLDPDKVKNGWLCDIWCRYCSIYHAITITVPPIPGADKHGMGTFCLNDRIANFRFQRSETRPMG